MDSLNACWHLSKFAIRERTRANERLTAKINAREAEATRKREEQVILTKESESSKPSLPLPGNSVGMQGIKNQAAHWAAKANRAPISAARKRPRARG